MDAVFLLKTPSIHQTSDAVSLLNNSPLKSQERFTIVTRYDTILSIILQWLLDICWQPLIPQSFLLLLEKKALQFVFVFNFLPCPVLSFWLHSLRQCLMSFFQVSFLVFMWLNLFYDDALLEGGKKVHRLKISIYYSIIFMCISQIE